MFKLLTNSITVLGCGLGFNIEPGQYNKFQLEPLVLKNPVSPTMNLDPWESYRIKQDQEISNEIFRREIEQWEN